MVTDVAANRQAARSLMPSCVVEETLRTRVLF